MDRPSTNQASPTELSYTALARLAPPTLGAPPSESGREARRNMDEKSSRGGPSTSMTSGLTPASLPAVPSTDPQISRVAPIYNSTTTSTMAPPRSCPPASVYVPMTVSSRRTPHPTKNPLHSNNPYQTPSVHQYSVRRPTSSTSFRISAPIEDRVSKLADRLQGMPTSDQQTAAGGARSRNEIYQFIDTLKNMQVAVSRTVNEQARVKKSRALVVLLNMFESILDERQSRLAAVDLVTRQNLQQLEHNAQQLHGQNEQLKLLCRDKDEQLSASAAEIQRLQQDINIVAQQNEQLRQSSHQAREECQREMQRAREAEAVASESENTRDGILANYARLTQENVDLQGRMQAVAIESERMLAEFDARQRDMADMQRRVDQLNDQLQQKDLDRINIERRVDELNSLLLERQVELQAANADRHRLQDELHSSQRNSNNASEALMQLRDQFSTLRRDTDSTRRFQEHQPLVSAVDRPSADGTWFGANIANSARSLPVQSERRPAEESGRGSTEQVSAPSFPAASGSIPSEQPQWRDENSTGGERGEPYLGRRRLAERMREDASDDSSGGIERLSATNAELKAKMDGLDSTSLEYSLDTTLTTRPRSASSRGAFSLDGPSRPHRQGLSQDENEPSNVGGAVRLALDGKPPHPNLKDYFYSQIDGTAL